MQVPRFVGNCLAEALITAHINQKYIVYVVIYAFVLRLLRVCYAFVLRLFCVCYAFVTRLLRVCYAFVTRLSGT